MEFNLDGNAEFCQINLIVNYFMDVTKVNLYN